MNDLTSITDVLNKTSQDSAIQIPLGVYMGPQSPMERRPSYFEARARVTFITEHQW